MQDIELAETQRKRLASAVGAISEARILEVDQQIARYRTSVKAYRQELQNRGLTTVMIDKAATGDFVSEFGVTVPTSPVGQYELQELKVDLGQQVQAGQTLGTLANHQLLAIEGRAFRDETPLLERSVTERWPVEVDFLEETRDWGSISQTFHIRQLANTIDPVNRTFAFLIPLENQAREVKDGDRTQTLWRFRPGQKLRIQVRTERLDRVFVVPNAAVTRDGPEAFVFLQNVNTFERQAVKVLTQDRTHTILAADNSLLPGSYVVQSAAAQLNRLLKAGGASGVPKGYHIHADGSLHKNEDEGK
jgi:membrane fusion protein, heavy metal efflux system